MLSPVRIAPRRARLGVEHLEDRSVPASLAIDSVELVDSSGILIDQATLPLLAGEQMFFLITYTTTDLPDDAEYGLSITMNQISLFASGITAGAGIPGDSEYTINTAAQFGGFTWFAERGFNELETLLFAEGGTDFSGSSYSLDNFEAFHWEDVFLQGSPDAPPELIRPISGSQGKTWVMVNGIDQDPDFNFIDAEGLLDYRGGAFTTDGQTSTDFQLADFSAADKGVQVLAAGPGFVTDLFDGAFDRNFDLTPPFQLGTVDLGNYLVIDHNNGWYTQYGGLRADSFQVTVGDEVQAGQVLGLVGGSGIPSLGARLTFTFTFDRGSGATSVLDPFLGDFWKAGAEPDYQGTRPASLNAGTTNYTFWTDNTALAERPVRVSNFAPGQEVHFWSSGTQPLGSLVNITWTDPNGKVADTTQFSASKVWDRTRDTFALPNNAAAGSWVVNMAVDGKTVTTQTFTVSANPSVPTIYAQAQQPVSPPSGLFFLPPGRSTPLNLGNWTQGSISPQATIRVTNIGSAPLVLGEPLTAEGVRFYTFVTEPIPPGQSVDLTVGFSGTIAGRFTGPFRIPTNDPNQPFFDGSVTGLSRIPSPGGDDGGDGTQPGDPNTGNNPLIGTADGIRRVVSTLTPGLAPGASKAFLDNSFAVGNEAGPVAQVVVYSQIGEERYRFEPFPGFTGGVRTAMADFDGDGIADIVVGTGPGRVTEVQIINGRTNRLMFSIQPFEESFTGGVFVTTGDVNNDGVPDLIITPDQGGGPRIRALDGRLAALGQSGVIFDFLGIDDPNFRGGARAAIGDINGDGRPDLVVAAGFGGGPRVAVFDGKTLATPRPTRLFGDFLAFELGLRNGVFVTVADVNNDGLGDLIVGGGPGGGPRVSVFSGADLLLNRPTELANFFVGNSSSRGGVRLAIKDLNANGELDLIAGSGGGKSSQLLSYPISQLSQPQPIPELNLTVFRDFTGGVYVG